LVLVVCREAAEKKAAAERYAAKHAAGPSHHLTSFRPSLPLTCSLPSLLSTGKTDEAKSDLARLAKIRKERAEAAAKRVAEAEEAKKALEAKKAAQKLRG
jgi:hypothetical protein